MGTAAQQHPEGDTLSNSVLYSDQDIQSGKRLGDCERGFVCRNRVVIVKSLFFSSEVIIENSLISSSVSYTHTQIFIISTSGSFCAQSDGLKKNGISYYLWAGWNMPSSLDFYFQLL